MCGSNSFPRLGYNTVKRYGNHNWAFNDANKSSNASRWGGTEGILYGQVRLGKVNHAKSRSSESMGVDRWSADWNKSIDWARSAE